MSKEKITINDFKMWLSGVEEMQDDDWTPSSTQWKRIRGKIDDIEEQVKEVVRAEVVNNYQPLPTYAMPPEIMGFDSIPSAMPSPPINPAQISPMFSTGGAMMTKTPDNLNGGTYESPLI